MTEFFAYLIGLLICAVVSFIAGLWAGIVFRADPDEDYEPRNVEDAARRVQ